jgi:hypothetical protein
MVADIIEWARQMEDAVKDELADMVEKVEDAEARIAEEDDPSAIAAAAAAAALSAEPQAAEEAPEELWVQCTACSKCAALLLDTLWFPSLWTARFHSIPLLLKDLTSTATWRAVMLISSLLH